MDCLQDVGETTFATWPITLTGLDSANNPVGPITISNGSPFTGLPLGTYTLTAQTAPGAIFSCGNTATVTITGCGATSSAKFGVVCLGPGGGLTLGFWSNKNGQALVGADDLAMLVPLNLRNANGTNFDPTNYTAFRTWLLGGTATNMAYMLSVQMTAMKLNVYNGKVNGSSLIYAPGTLSANTAGFATVNAVLAEANTELGLHGVATSGSPYRAYQEKLKNALDNANNNLTFVQSTPCTFTF
jgi:hypothetical protein